MLYKKHGKTGIKLSCLGFGGMRFADPNDLDQSAELVCAAYEQGINYFDTAPGYPRSEEIFGLALKEMLKTRDKQPFYIATKSGYEDVETVRKDLETSLKRMGLDSIDFFHAWCVITYDSYERRKQNGVLKALEQLKDEGVIRHICVSTHMSGEDTAKMLKDYPFEAVLLGYSAMNFRYREKALIEAEKQGVGVVVMNPLGGGIIPRHADRFQFMKTRDNESVSEAALRFLFNDNRITTALVGFSNLEQLDQAIKAVDGFASIPEKEIARIRDGLVNTFDSMCTGCGYCDFCPQGIPIPRFLESYNHYMLSGKTENIINRLKWHWGIPETTDLLDQCTKCGLCEDACTQSLPIRERLQTISELLKPIGK